MKSEDVQHVIALMERHGIATFDYEQGSVQLRLARGGEGRAVVSGRPDAPEKAEPETIVSPSVGIVLHTHPASPDGPALLPRDVAKGEVVAYIRTGLTLRRVMAARDCRLLRALVAESTGVGFGDALFEIAP